jgi:hypothetical protein
MSTRITRRGVTLLAIVGALLTAVFAAAPQADAATLYACVKKSNGAMRLVKPSTKCRKSERKVSWSTSGPAGRNGINGINGKNGANGTNGTNGSNGTNGQDLTSHTPLPSGQSESGFFTMAGGTSTGGFVGQGISFSQPLSAALGENHVVFNEPGATSPNCAGFGQAGRGFVCLYAAENSGMTFFKAFDFQFNPNSADKYGFSLYFAIGGSGAFVDGSWTVTAP